jgi:uncharacterized protein with ACT and thioredoxin-like domain
MSLFSQIKAIKLLPHIHCLVHEIKLQGDRIMNAIERLRKEIHETVLKIDGLYNVNQAQAEALQRQAEEIAALKATVANWEAFADEGANTLDAAQGGAPTGGESAAGIKD